MLTVVLVLVLVLGTDEGMIGARTDNSVHFGQGGDVELDSKTAKHLLELMKVGRGDGGYINPGREKIRKGDIEGGRLENDNQGV